MVELYFNVQSDNGSLTSGRPLFVPTRPEIDNLLVGQLTPCNNGVLDTSKVWKA